MDIPAARRRLDGLTAVILAGGQGTRLARLIADVPKPLVSVAGQPFLHWVTTWLIGRGAGDLVYSIGYLGDQIEAWVTGLRLPERVRAASRREESPLGTGGAILGCLDICQDLVLIVNGDSLLLAELSPAIHQLQMQRLDGLILAVPVPNGSRFGRLELNSSGLLRSLTTPRPGAGLVNGGVYLFPRTVLERCLPVRPTSFELELLPRLLRRGARIGISLQGVHFIDIGVPESLAKADEFVAEHRAAIDG